MSAPTRDYIARDAIDPDWKKGGRVHNSPEQKIAIAAWADEMASNEEWE